VKSKRQYKPSVEEATRKKVGGKKIEREKKGSAPSRRR
jgi:hypothetical protein